MQEKYYWDGVWGGGGGGELLMQMDSEGGGEGWLKERSSLL